MNHKSCPDCSLMILHYTLVLSQLLSEGQNPCTFHPPEDRYLFSFDMFTLIIQFPSGCCSLLCHVGNQLTQLSHYPRTQHYTSYSLRRLFMMSQEKMLNSPVFFSLIQRDLTNFSQFIWRI